MVDECPANQLGCLTADMGSIAETKRDLVSSQEEIPPSWKNYTQRFCSAVGQDLGHAWMMALARHDARTVGDRVWKKGDTLAWPRCTHGCFKTVEGTPTTDEDGRLPTWISSLSDGGWIHTLDDVYELAVYFNKAYSRTHKEIRTHVLRRCKGHVPTEQTDRPSHFALFMRLMATTEGQACLESGQLPFHTALSFPSSTTLRVVLETLYRPEAKDEKEKKRQKKGKASNS